jgi:hypothetical protein
MAATQFMLTVQLRPTIKMHHWLLKRARSTLEAAIKACRWL